MTRPTSDATGFIQRRQEFKIGNVSAVTGPTGTGEMSAGHRALYEEQRRYDGIVYTVLSYDTPMAWVLADGYIEMPNAQYSQSTTRHQSIILRAFGNRFVRDWEARRLPRVKVGEGRSPYGSRNW